MKLNNSTNFKVTIMYDGSDFFGWAKQIKHRTIRHTIEEILSDTLAEKISITGCSRTDRNVHSRNFVFNFKTERAITEIKLFKLLTIMSPRDIQILKISTVDADFNARFNAKYKIYHYQLAKRKPNVFNDRYYGYAGDGVLNLAKINKAITLLIGEHDFTSFSSYNRFAKNPICNIFDFKVSENENDYNFKVSGNRFLKHMVRILVANLILVGKNELSVNDFKKLLLAKQRHISDAIIVGNGLYLDKVIY